MAGNKIKLLIFDLDDTLIDTSDLYWNVRESFISYISDNNSNKQELENIFEKIDTQNTAIYGYHPKRYEITMLQMCNELNIDLSIEQKATICSIANRIMNDVPNEIPGALDLLEWTYERYTLTLMTRGIDEVQNKKIKKYSLTKYFKYIEIVDKKDEDKFLNLINKLGVQPSETVIIGDSIKAEINPALNIGAFAIHYQYTHHTYKWLQEHVDTHVGRHYFKTKSLKEVIEALKKIDSI